MTYNVRGVGASQGYTAWVTPGNDPADFAAVEQRTINLLCGDAEVEVRRLVSLTSSHYMPLPKRG